MSGAPRRSRPSQQRAVRSEAVRRLAFLSQLRPLLSAGVSISTLQQVARLASRSLCEFCIVDVVERGRLRRVEIAHADAGLFDRLRAEADAFIPAHGGRLERMLATGEAELVSGVRRPRTSSDVRLRAQRGAVSASTSGRSARSGFEDLDFWPSFVPVSYMAVPIEVCGEVVAIMTFAACRTPLRFDEERLAFAREVAAWCGLALKGARSSGGHAPSARGVDAEVEEREPPSRRERPSAREITTTRRLRSV